MKKNINKLLDDFYIDIEKSEKKEPDITKALNKIKKQIKKYTYIYFRCNNYKIKEKIKTKIIKNYNLLFYYQSIKTNYKKTFSLDNEIFKLPNIYIIDQQPKRFEIDETKLKNIDISKGLTEEQANELLKWTANNTRDNLNLHKIEKEDVYGNNSLLETCGLSQFSTLFPLQQLGLKVTINNTKKFCNNRHAYGTVTIPINDNGKITNKRYLIDCTYRQFFLLKHNIISHYINSTPNPGFFINLSDDEKIFAKELLKNGFIEATQDNLEKYFKPFFAGNYQLKEIDRINEDFSKLNIIDIIDNNQSEFDYEEEEFLNWGFNLSLPQSKQRKI